MAKVSDEYLSTTPWAGFHSRSKSVLCRALGILVQDSGGCRIFIELPTDKKLLQRKGNMTAYE